MRDYWTILELVEVARHLDLRCFPQSLSGARAFVKKNGWDDCDRRFRGRPARNGKSKPSREYHVSLLPDDMLARLFCDYSQRLNLERLETEKAGRWSELVAFSADQFSALQIQVLTARLLVMDQVQFAQFSNGETLTWAIRRFCADPDFLGLSIDVIGRANPCNSNKPSVSQSTIQRWFKAREDEGLLALIPSFDVLRHVEVSA